MLIFFYFVEMYVTLFEVKERNLDWRIRQIIIVLSFAFRFFSRLGMVPVIALVGFELFDRGFLVVHITPVPLIALLIVKFTIIFSSLIWFSILFLI